MVCLSMKLSCYRITCWWFFHKRSCNNKWCYLCRALYMFPHSTLTDEFTEINSEGSIFPRESCALSNHRRRCLWEKKNKQTLLHPKPEYHVFIFLSIFLIWMFSWNAGHGHKQLIEKGLAQTISSCCYREKQNLSPMLALSTWRPFCRSAASITDQVKNIISPGKHWVGAGLGVRAGVLTQPSCITPISGNVCDMCELRDYFTLLRGIDIYSYLWSKIK